jgi:hypothetical protein
MTRLGLPRVSTLSFKRATVIRAASALLALLTIGALAGIAEACFWVPTLPLAGQVVDQNGTPISGATVTLLSSDDLGGFSPDAATPQTTEGGGGFSFNVVSGLYEVTAHVAGCLDATSAPQSIRVGKINLVTAVPVNIVPNLTQTRTFTTQTFAPTLNLISDLTPAQGLTLTVECAAPVVTPLVNVTGGSLQYGQGGTFTATVGETVPAVVGAIQFKVDGVNLGSPVSLSNGSATSPSLSTLSGFPLGAGSHGVEADFVPADVTKFGAALNTAGFTVTKTATTTALALQGSSAVATVAAVGPGSGTPTGAVSFTRDGVAIGSAQLSNGVATLTGLAAGAGNVAAAYAGDSNFTGSSGSTARQMPTIVATVSSATAKTSFGWYRSPVTVSFTCTTNGSPLTAACPAPVTLANSGAAQSVTKTILAQDGGAATAVVNGINIDRGRPSLWVEGVVSGQHYASAPTVSCVGADSLSGIASCTVAVGHASHGVVHYTATATDKAGNVKTGRGFYFLNR